MRQPCVLLKYGELALKGRNRGRFEQQLLDNVRRSVAGLGPGVRVRRRRGVIVLSAPGRPGLHAELVARAREVIGVSVVQPALRVDRTPEAAAAAAVELARGARPDRSVPRFAVRARRRQKDFPLTSGELAALIGAEIGTELGWPVDLSTPDVEVAVEVDRREIFVAVERHHGRGGLPVGCSGRALALLSGGYDSPVAAHRAMRRGLACDFVHFTGAPLTGPSSAYKAYALVRRLARYQGEGRLWLIPLGHAQRELALVGAGSLHVVAQRRLMVRAADRLARRHGAQALVTGDSLGQVSSQTLSNLATVEDVATLPLLRPLLAWDKEEIMAEARRLGTAEISRLPDEDCCTLLAPRRVATRTTPGSLARLEQRLDVEATVENLLTKARLLHVAPEEEDVQDDAAGLADDIPARGDDADAPSAVAAS
ncbi:tRNA uracil 4-sulfurtransferase ThiI [Streptomyces sp. TRM68367]|uniref:tRNA uracil 4-sulfurtransferase ThiI n=1 Tax=Streptomyces sp. TRM68367 TaxID=2758415 RepID=UPI00165C8618|nr:tRNA uracil 4-sulfurtransferase ThiI [Streptomyces sp. TRM68367]MBC9727613.1 tRNA 4-thiouridine(8) synthase ThiI [Streptomyces sp. TRM68367]